MSNEMEKSDGEQEPRDSERERTGDLLQGIGLWSAGVSVAVFSLVKFVQYLEKMSEDDKNSR
jgi:hypothetical protein